MPDFRANYKSTYLGPFTNLQFTSLKTCVMSRSFVISVYDMSLVSKENIIVPT